MDNNVGVATALIEAGFECVTGEYGEGGKIFKKLKTDNYTEAGSYLKNDGEGR